MVLPQSDVPGLILSGEMNGEESGGERGEGVREGEGGGTVDVM